MHDCICAHVLFLLSCVHTLGLGLDLGNSLNQRERKSANTQVAKLPKKKAYGLYLTTPIPSKSNQSVIVCDCLWNICILFDRSEVGYLISCTHPQFQTVIVKAKSLILCLPVC